MKTVKGFCILFMLHLCFLDSGRTGKVLVWPADFSHWINLQVILEELHFRGHEITVLVPSQNLTKIPYHVEILHISVTKETLIEELNTILYEETFELPKLSWWEMQIKLADLERKFLLINRRVCESAITNKELLNTQKIIRQIISFFSDWIICVSVCVCDLRLKTRKPE